jgi:hypothetical protein
MQLKTSAFQLSIVWVTASLLTACSGPTANCDDPSTPVTEYCGSVASSDATGQTGTTSTHSGGSTFIYYRSTGSTYYRSNPARTSTIRSGGSTGRSGFGSTGGSRSGAG